MSPVDTVKCSGIKGKLITDPTYCWKRCLGPCTPVDGRCEKHVTLYGLKIYLAEFDRYLGDHFSPGCCNYPQL